MNMIKELNILIVGVGGQGVILMSELLGEVAVKEGLNVRGSEVLGMAVRGGSVSSIVRIGSDVYGPLIPMGKGDIIIGMEPAEALRNIVFLSNTGMVILNTKKVVPFTASLGERDYPSLDTIIEKIKLIASKVVALNANQLAEEAGSPLTANIVMLGALFASDRLPMKADTMKEALKAHFPAKLAPVNLKAFDLGYEKCRESF